MDSLVDRTASAVTKSFVSLCRDLPTCEGDRSCLTHVDRHQRFYVWLCALNCTKNELLIIRTIRWSQTIEIEVEPTRCRGARARLISDPQPDQPIFLKRNLLIPSCALQGPSVSVSIACACRARPPALQANNAQLLVWRPSQGQPVLIVPPKQRDASTLKYLRLLLRDGVGCR